LRFFGYDVTVEKKLPPGSQLVGGGGRFNSLWGVISEPFSGAWQGNMEIATEENRLRFGAVFACIRLISSDISKLRIKLVQQRAGIWEEITENSPFLPVLRKPNTYQNRIQFVKHWIISKLIYGNTYVLKQYDERHVVTQLHILDPNLVNVLVSPDGGVYYELKIDVLTNVFGQVAVPATEIIHDRGETLFHPLIGVSPLWASAASSTQGVRIQANSAKFFENMSRPSGVLTSPNAISPDTAKRLKETFEANFSGSNLGRLLVGGDGLKYEAMTIPASDAQLIEQLKWTGEDVARAFGVPLHKIGLGQPPTFNNIAQMNQSYYSETLQQLMEVFELCLDEGLGLLNAGYACSLDEDNLLRLDPLMRADIAAKRITAGYSAPNEERFIENRRPAEGGDTPYMQQQMFPLKLLAKRTFEDAAGGKPTAPQEPSQAPSGPSAEASDEEAARAMTAELINRFLEVT
jgi:HK97 family phage portal protein